MSYFKRMYTAALAKNNDKLQALLAEGACIDEREHSKQFLSVAGKLAFNGHLDAAKNLINNFGAGPEFVVYGLLEREDKQAAIELAQQYDINFNHEFNLLESFADFRRGAHYDHCAYELPQKNLLCVAHAGDTQSIRKIFNESSIEDIYGDSSWKRTLPLSTKEKEQFLHQLIIKHAGNGGHLKLAENEYVQFKIDLKEEIGLGDWLARWSYDAMYGTTSMRFANKKLALHSLCFIENDEFRKILVREIKKVNCLSYDIYKVHQQANIVRGIMHESGVNYEQALAQQSLQDKQETTQQDSNVKPIRHSPRLFKDSSLKSFNTAPLPEAKRLRSKP